MSNGFFMLNQQTITSALQPIFSRYPVRFGYVFGSYASGDTGPLSDLDIAVYLDYELGARQQEELIGEIRADIEKQLAMPDKVDLVLLNQELPPALERSIVYDGQLIYNKDDTARAYFESDAICRWLDWKPHHDRFMQEILSAS